VVFDFTERYDPDAIRAVEWGIGRYDEVRAAGMYTSPIYQTDRRLHVGVDLWAPAGTPVFAFADGVVYATADNANPRDYGPTVVTEHEVDGQTLWALYGHLSRTSLASLRPGRRLAAGDRVGTLGTADENGGWVPHLHFQLSLERPDGADLPGVVEASRRDEALRRYPDPRHVLGPLY
jgi:murein DD-endopeptidase MepM/ murein hydrolase activator NlpD